MPKLTQSEIELLLQIAFGVADPKRYAGELKRIADIVDGLPEGDWTYKEE